MLTAGVGVLVGRDGEASGKGVRAGEEVGDPKFESGREEEAGVCAFRPVRDSNREGGLKT